MLPHYKCIDCCDRCRQKGVFTVDENAVEAWTCPFEEFGCQSRLKLVSWPELHKSKLIKGTVGLAVLFTLIYLVTGGSEIRQLQEDVVALQKDVKGWNAEVNKLSQNRGLGDPYVQLWKDKIDRRVELLGATPPDNLKQEIEMLNEELVRLDVELERAAGLKVPEVKGVAVNTQYEKAREEGKSLRNDVSKLNGQARLLDEKPTQKTLARVERQIKQGVGLINKRSKPTGTAPVTDLNESKKAYIGAVNDAKKNVSNAIVTEQERRRLEKLGRLAERKRLKEEAERTSLAEKMKAWNDAQPIIRIACSSAMEQHLVVRLIEGYYEAKSGRNVRLIPHPSQTSHRRYVTSPTQSIEVSQIVTNPGNDRVRFDLDRRKGESILTVVIALDAMVALVADSQPLGKITQFDLEKVMAGKITNWKSLGGSNSPIHLQVPRKGSDGGQVIDAASRALLSQNSGKIEVDSVVAQLATNSRAFGIGAFHNSVNQKRLVISSSKDDPGFAPTPSSIATENYRYSRRVFGHTSKTRSSDVTAFMKFVLSDKGQAIVAAAGYIDMRPNSIPYPKPPQYVVNAIGAESLIAAYRVNSNFRFSLNSSDLDIKARGDVERIKDSLTIHLNRKKECLLVGFTDNQGAADYNMDLSRKRASHVSNRLVSQSVQGLLRTYGGGMEWAIADNDTERGKAQNRRVEVWIIETR